MEKLTGYCIDSDILIDYLRGLTKARDFLLTASAEAPFYISVISIAEVYSGKETKDTEKREFVEKFLQNFSIIELSPAIARFAGELRRDYQRPFADMIIAASALTYTLSIVTKNAKHYRGIKNLKVIIPY